MEPLTLQLRHGHDEAIECWDDDGELECDEDIQLRTASRATSVTNSSFRRSEHRDSISSRHSARSDLDSNAGDGEDWQVPLLDNDDQVTKMAIASATRAGIPLPADVPKSALVGGSIKRLGRRSPKKTPTDDWSEDVEFPGPDGTLELKQPQESTFPELLQPVSSTATSPVKSNPAPWNDDIPSSLQSISAKLHGFRDEDDDGLDLGDIPTIKVPKARSPQKTASPIPAEPEVEDFGQDFELPAGNSPLQLSSKKPNDKTSSPVLDDFDLDWSEGSIGVRFGGTARDRPSNASSSMSVVSPSISSNLTMASDDDFLDGLVIPQEPLDLNTTLRKKQDVNSADITGNSHKPHADQESSGLDDFFSGLETEGDNALTGKRQSLNPNIKYKSERPESAARQSGTTITFTPSSGSPKTRLPRLSDHSRSHSTHLETVSELGASPSRFPGVQPRTEDNYRSRLLRQGPTSVSNRSTLSQRLIEARAPKGPVGNDHASSSSNHLARNKQSLLATRNSRASAQPVESPRYHGSSHSVAGLTVRPFTPTGDTKPSTRRVSSRSFPADDFGNQSPHDGVKEYRRCLRANSSGSGNALGLQGSTARTSRFSRSEPISGNFRESNVEGKASQRPLNRSTRRRHFGDGSELESFDDLPTSTSTESRFIKNPTGRGAPRPFRSRPKLNQNTPQRPETPSQPATPVTATGTPPSFTPRFARDTNASRIAREQRIASMTASSKSRESNPLVPLSANSKANSTLRGQIDSASISGRRQKASALPRRKPHLIKPMGHGVQEARCESLLHLCPVDPLTNTHRR